MLNICLKLSVDTGLTDLEYLTQEKISALEYMFELSIFDHSCNPNAIVSCEKNQLTIRAIREIKNEPVLIEYLDLKLPKSQRQASLLSSFFFKCLCKKKMRT